MASPHPPLKNIWLAIVDRLYNFGPTPKSALRYELSLSNKQLKTHTKLMKMRGLIDVKNGTVWLMPLGIARYEQTKSLDTEPVF